MESRESELRAQLDRLETMGMDWLKTLRRPGNSSNATIQVNAGGIGMWVAVTCCAVMFVLGVSMAVLGGLAYTSTQQRLDRMQDYLNAIYMQAPQLKPKETTK